MNVSIITATLNSAGTIGDAAQSLFIQSYPHIQYIIKDGGSTDNTLDIVTSFGDRVDKVLTGPDAGIYDAINQGIGMSDGEILGLLHADDLLAGPEVIENVVRTFQKERCDALYGDLDYVYRSDPHKILRRWRPGEFTGDMIRKGWMPPHPTLFIRRELFNTHGPYNTAYKIAADYDFVLRILTDPGRTISYLNEVLVKMRSGGASNRTLSGIIQKSREDIRIMRTHNLPAPVYTLLSKNLSKISQFFSS